VLEHPKWEEGKKGKRDGPSGGIRNARLRRGESASTAREGKKAASLFSLSRKDALKGLQDGVEAPKNRIDTRDAVRGGKKGESRRIFEGTRRKKCEKTGGADLKDMRIPQGSAGTLKDFQDLGEAGGL